MSLVRDIEKQSDEVSTETEKGQPTTAHEHTPSSMVERRPELDSEQPEQLLLRAQLEERQTMPDENQNSTATTAQAATLDQENTDIDDPEVKAKVLQMQFTQLSRLAQAVCDVVQTRLPRELRDIIYGYVIYRAPEVRLRRKLFQERFGRLYHEDVEREPGHLFDPAFSSSEARLELAELWHQTAPIRMERLSMLNDLEEDCPWKCGVSSPALMKHLIVFLWDVTLFSAVCSGFVSHSHLRDTVSQNRNIVLWNLEHLFQLKPGTRITLEFQFEYVNNGDIGLKIALDYFFPTLHRLRDAGYRVDARFLNPISLKVTCVINEDVEFTPLGWFGYAKEYAKRARLAKRKAKLARRSLEKSNQ